MVDGASAGTCGDWPEAGREVQAGPHKVVSPPDDLSASVVLEEATLVPVNTASFTLTAIPRNADGTAGASIVSTFTCVR